MATSVLEWRPTQLGRNQLSPEVDLMAIICQNARRGWVVLRIVSTVMEVAAVAVRHLVEVGCRADGIIIHEVTACAKG